MKQFAKQLVITSLALAIVPLTNVYAHDDDDDDDDGMEAREFEAEMVQVNSSGVYADVEMKLIDGKTLVVEIEASGLEPGKPHPQHIHGFNKPVSASACPTAENDTDGDGIITIGEGVPAFGPILLPLVPFNLVDNAGNLDYKATFTINPGDLQPLHKRTVVLHGMTVNGAYIPSLPIACGQLVEEVDD